MKRYSMSDGASMTHTPEHPERTARQSGIGMDFDIYFQVWPNRPSMARSIRMQERGCQVGQRTWKAIIPLRETEGY